MKSIYIQTFFRPVFYSIISVTLIGCATFSSKHPQPPQALSSFSQDVQQVIVVDPLCGSSARATTWEFKDGTWHQVFWPMKAMVGRKGIAFLNEKREGDGRTPSGRFKLRTAFGYAPSIDTKLLYRQSTDNDFWVDDVASSQYNQWVTGKPNATSFEDMKRKDDLYKYGAVIEYNTDPIVAGNGSAIFMHIWRAPGKATSGCVSFSPRSLKHVLTWLDASRHPVIIINP